MFKDIVDNDDAQGVEDYFKAVKKGKVNTVKDLLDLDPMLAIEVDDQMRTALHHACYTNNIEMATLLLQHDMSKVLLKAKDMKRKTPGEIASKHKLLALQKLIQSYNWPMLTLKLTLHERKEEMVSKEHR